VVELAVSSLPERPNDGALDPVVDSRSVSVWTTLLTCATSATFARSSLVRALFACEPGLKPAGAMVIVLPMLLLTLAILFSTAFCATSIVRLRQMLSPNIMTIDMVRTPFRKAFRMPLLTGFMCGRLLFRLILTGVYGAQPVKMLNASAALSCLCCFTLY
jgi:hypothetical protein